MAADKWVSGGLANATTFMDSFVPEMWTDGIRYFFQKKLIMASLATDWSDVVKDGGDQIHMPRINEQSTQAKGQGTAITWASNTTDEGEDVLDIDKHDYSAMLIEDVARIQASDDLMSKYTSEMGYALAKKVDVQVEAALDAAAHTFELSGTGQDDGFHKADLGAVMRTLGQNDIDYLDGSVFLLFSPALYGSLFTSDDFVRADVIGDRAVTSVSRLTGYIGQLAGIPVFTSNVIGTAAAGTFGFIVQQKGMNIAWSKRPRVQEQYDIDYLGTKVVTDAVWGYKAVSENTDGKRKLWKIVNAV